jgi:hypothetical protein
MGTKPNAVSADAGCACAQVIRSCCTPMGSSRPDGNDPIQSGSAGRIPVDPQAGSEVFRGQRIKIVAIIAQMLEYGSPCSYEGKSDGVERQHRDCGPEAPSPSVVVQEMTPPRDGSGRLRRRTEDRLKKALI